MSLCMTDSHSDMGDGRLLVHIQCYFLLVHDSIPFKKNHYNVVVYYLSISYPLYLQGLR
jgi:hypothetical protein